MIRLLALVLACLLIPWHAASPRCARADVAALALQPDDLQDPLTILGPAELLAWYRSDLGVTLNSGNVAAWADQSGNNQNLLQNSATAQPPYTAGGAGVAKITFPYSSIYELLGGSFTQSQPFTTVLVAGLPSYGPPAASTAVWLAFTSSLGGTQKFEIFQFNTGDAQKIRSELTSAFAYTIPGTYNPMVLLTTWNGATSNMQVNGGTITSGNIGSAAVTANGSMLVGGTGATNGSSGAYYQELLVIAGTPTAAQLTTLQAYFQGIYGLQ